MSRVGLEDMGRIGKTVRGARLLGGGRARVFCGGWRLEEERAGEFLRWKRRREPGVTMTAGWKARTFSTGL